MRLLKQGMQLVPDGRIRRRRTGEGVRQREESEQDVVCDGEETLWCRRLCLWLWGLLGLLQRRGGGR